MAKPHSIYICQECGASHPKWGGRCDACGAWNSLVEEMPLSSTPKGLGKGKGKVLEFHAMNAPALATPPRRDTGLTELNRALGGGLVVGSAVLIGGDPGIGKSTLLLQMTASMARAGAEVVYVSGEESVAQIQLRAERLGLGGTPVKLGAASSVRDILTSLEKGKYPDVLIIDSIQTMFLDTLDSAPGTVAQVRASAHELIRVAKQRDIAILLVGHVTKEGQIAGPRVLEHMVDCVLYFEGERGHLFRILRTVKNRFGATDEIGVFEMTDKGLQQVENPSSLFLTERDHAVSGSAVLAGIEGSRPMLLEMQALIAPSQMATPRRAVVGWDSGRLAMILAVLETRGGVRFGDREVYLSVAGGLRVNEPAADLAAAAALLSALMDAPLPEGAVFFGEIGLSGEIRPVSRQETRLKEAAKLGFAKAYLPFIAKSTTQSEGLSLTPLRHVSELVELIAACKTD
ncbi:MAG: DNA repair protein RadA [Rickettsiales bacterium]|nr:DNA repair protein RadA [Rickettsiales bacterium]